MPKARTATKRNTLTVKAKSRTKKTSTKLRAKKRFTGDNGAFEIFSLFKGKKERAQKNFSTSFEYGNLSFNIKSTVKGSTVHFNIKVTSKNFNFSGIATMNASAFANLQDMFDHIKSNISKMR